MFDFNNSSDADEISETILQLRKTIAETQARIQNLETVEGAVEVLKARGATVLIEPPNPGCYSGQLADIAEEHDLDQEMLAEFLRALSSTLDQIPHKR